MNHFMQYSTLFHSEPLTTKGPQVPIFSHVLSSEMLFDYSAPLPVLPGGGSATVSLYAGQCNIEFFPDSLKAGGGFPDIALPGIFLPAEAAFESADTPRGFNLPLTPVLPLATNAAGNTTFEFPDPPERSNVPVPPSPVVGPVTHIYWQLDYTAQVEQHLKLSIIQDKTRFRCAFQGCTGDVFTTKRKAYAHVYEHLGITKHYECACGVQFACLASAKRHLITRRKRFACKHCPQQYARKDYRALHQKRCGERRVQANKPNLHIF